MNPALPERFCSEPAVEASSPWSRIPSVLTLGSDEVHVFRLVFASAEKWMAQLTDPLSRDERERAQRFRFPHLCKQYSLTRGMLRLLLGHYLQRSPQDVVLSMASRGKPRLACAQGLHPLRFNVSHSGGIALLAFALEREVGIDVEQVRPMGDLSSLVENNFSETERAVWREIPEPQREASFFSCWTRKEAFVKAMGDGLGFGLDGFDVTFAPGTEARLLRVSGMPQAAARFGLRGLPIDAGFAAALVVERPEPAIRTLCASDFLASHQRRAAA